MIFVITISYRKESQGDAGIFGGCYYETLEAAREALKAEVGDSEWYDPSEPDSCYTENEAYNVIELDKA